MGANFGFMGTRFLAAVESNAPADYRSMVIASSADDITLTSEVSGMPANMLRLSLERAGLSSKAAPTGTFDVSAQTSAKAWRDVWGAGHGVGAVTCSEPVAQIANQLIKEYGQPITAETT